MGFGVPSLASRLGGKGAEGAAIQSICIDDALSWAYRIELPKAARERMGTVAGISSDVFAMLRVLGTRVDGSSGEQFGVVGWDGPPHPDALLIAEAVSLLDGSIGVDAELFDIEGVDFLADAAFAGITAAERASAHAAGAALVLTHEGQLRASVSTQVATAAVLGRVRPIVQDEAPVRHIVQHNGKPAWFRTIRRVEGIGRTVHEVEIDGFNPRRQRPHIGAYRKTWLSPDPSPIVAERIEYQIWRAALDALRADLAGRLATMDLEPSRLPWWPWESTAAERESPVRILDCEKRPARSADAA